MKKEQAPSLFSRTDTPQLATTAPSSFLSKPSLTSNPLSATKEESPVVTTTPTFSSLINANANQSSGSTFKGFAGFSGSTTSIFSATPSTDSATTDKPAAGMFSFAGGAAKPGGLFGAGTPTSNLFGSGATFPGATAGQTGGQEEEGNFLLKTFN